MTGFAVSVVIPLFNKAPFIRRTLESVLAQTLAPDSILIVDDGSTDGSVEAIADLITGRVRLIRQRNAGPGPARNHGIAEARSEWVALIDGDDLWAPDHLATLAAVHRACPEAGVLATRYRSGSASDPPASRQDGSVATPRMFDYFAAEPGSSPVCASSVAIRRSVLLEYGGFGDFWPGEDYELWARLALDHKFAVSDHCTAIYVQQTGGLMEQHDAAGSGGGTLQPIFATLDRAILDPRYVARHQLIRTYCAKLLRQNVRQALYRAAPSDARRFAAELRKQGDAKLGWLAPLCWLPAPVLKAGRVVWRVV